MLENPNPSASRRSRLVGLFPTGNLARSVSILAGGAAIGQIIVLVSSVVINRLYSPTSFGQYGAASAVVAVIAAVASLKYELAIPLPPDETRAADLLALALLVAIGSGVLLGIVLAVAGRPILGLFHADALEPYIWLIVAAELAGGFNLALLSFAIRHKRFGKIARARVGQSLTSVGTQIAIGIGTGSPAGLMAGEAMGGTAANGMLSREAFKASAGALRRVSLSGIAAASRRYRSFAMFSAPATLLNSIGYFAPVLLIVALYGPKTGGLFAFGQRLIQAPLALLTVSVAQVFIAEAAILARRNPRELRVLFSRTMRRLALIGTPIALALALAAPFLTPIVFGERWQQAGVYVAILAPFFLFQLATSPLGGTLDVLERQDLHLIREVVRVSITSGAIVVANVAHLTAIQAIALFSFCGCIGYVLHGLISWIAIAQAGDHAPSARPEA